MIRIALITLVILGMMVLGSAITLYLLKEHRLQQHAEREATIAEIGEKYAMVFLRNLRRQRLRVIKEQGPVAGFEFCSDNALAITLAAEDSLPSGVKIKRTSLKYRNPDNAPSPAEIEALEFFEDTFQHQFTPPEYYLQTIGDSLHPRYNYYKPLKIEGLCMHCHGTETTIPPKVQQLLTDYYPEDKATGYQPNDFRGVVRVTIPAELIP
ncbi:MAG: DUF3365 domain-containing protein [Gemmatimonadetes bacterium]|nr:MAG: DUF3365 domain-containing protein [Gemmatimonadota bacterium]